MTDRQSLIEILNLCITLDQKASEFYSCISSCSELPDLKAFWKEMADEENEHVLFWKKILDLAEKDMVPQVFENPGEVIQELEQINIRITEMRLCYQKNNTLKDDFLLAYRLEFYIMNPAFAVLLQYMKRITDEKNPDDQYEEHLQKFFTTFGKYAGISPEIELLSETITKLWKENRKLATACFVDELTGVCNRRGFFQTVRPILFLAKRNRQNIGVLMIDIDDFKLVNDLHGHLKGDQVLREIGGILRADIRRSDILGRYGGEEFIVLLNDITPEHMEAVAEKMRAKVAEAQVSGINITISIGGAAGKIESDVENGLGSMIKSADEALYQAKHQGKNQFKIHNL